MARVMLLQPVPTRPWRPGECQFVLVAHGADGQRDVYAGDFEHPLASFDERQAGCDYASGLAKASSASIVLILESPHSAASSD